MKLRDHLFIIFGAILGVMTFIFAAIIGSVAKQLTETSRFEAIGDSLEECIPSIVMVVMCLIMVRSGGWRSFRPKIQIPRALIFLPVLLFPIVNFAGLTLSGFPGYSEFAFALLSCFFIGLAEELCFRGYLFQLFSRWSPSAAVVLTAAIFGLLHFSQGLIGIGITFIVGLSYGLARSAGASLRFLILIHTLTNIPHSLPYHRQEYYDFLSSSAFILTGVISIWYLVIPSHWSSKRETSQQMPTV